MEKQTKPADASWKKLESIFNVQVLRTPPLNHITVQIPKAPKKIKPQIRKEGLKPRKLTYEEENTKKQEDKPNKAWEDSGIVLWAMSSSSLKMEDANKENRPEFGKRYKSKGKPHVKSDDKVLDRSREDDVFKSDFRSLRI